MSKQSKNTSDFSVSELIELFGVSPETAYQNLISSGIYFKNKRSPSFWDAYIQLPFPELIERFPESLYTFQKVVGLKLFHDLNEFYKAEKLKRVAQIAERNPSPADLIKSLFLCLELGECSPQPSNFPVYTEESLESIKILLKELLPDLKPENQSSYSASLTEICNDLVRVQTDINLLEDFIDAFVWADLSMAKKENAKGYRLTPSENTKTENLYILNQLKNDIKRGHERAESQSKISQEDHFKSHDPKYKTDKGLATIFHNKGFSVTEQDGGTTSMELDDSYFGGFDSPDPKVRNSQTVKMMMVMMEQNFHYQYRHALSEIYQPNDEIDIHHLYVQVTKDIRVSLFDLLCAMSCLIAKADGFRYLGELPRGSISSHKRDLSWRLFRQPNPMSEEEIHTNLNSYLVNSLQEIENKNDIKSFLFVERNALLNWFHGIEELKQKSAEELGAIIHLLSDLNSPLSFNPLYYTGKNYYFSYVSCRKFNLNRMFYDKYASDKLFNPAHKAKDERRSIEEAQKERERNFRFSLATLLKTKTPFVLSGLEFGPKNKEYDFGGLEGDCDVLAYFEKEKLLFAIQVKLSNVSPRSERRKAEWVTKRILEKGVEQVAKDMKLAQLTSGLKFISNKLKTQSEIVNPTIYPLIVTDNFFADHCSFRYNEAGNKVKCVSQFELKHLLLGKKVHEKQQDLPSLSDEKVGSQLMEAIEKNTFWSFLDEHAANFELRKELSAVNEEHRIEFKI